MKKLLTILVAVGVAAVAVADHYPMDEPDVDLTHLVAYLAENGFPGCARARTPQFRIITPDPLTPSQQVNLIATVGAYDQQEHDTRQAAAVAAKLAKLKDFATYTDRELKLIKAIFILHNRVRILEGETTNTWAQFITWGQGNL